MATSGRPWRRDERTVIDFPQMVLDFYEKSVRFEDDEVTEAGYTYVLSAREREKIEDALVAGIKLGVIDGLDEDSGLSDDPDVDALMAEVWTKLTYEVATAMVAYASVQLMMRGDVIPAYRDGEWLFIPAEAVRQAKEKFGVEEDEE